MVGGAQEDLRGQGWPYWRVELGKRDREAAVDAPRTRTTGPIGAFRRPRGPSGKRSLKRDESCLQDARRARGLFVKRWKEEINE